MNKKDITIGIGSCLIGAAVLIYSFFIRISVELSEPGPRLFPRIAGVIFIICGIGIMLNAFNDPVKANKFLDKEGSKKLGKVILICFLYWAALKLLGFIIATPFVIIALSRAFSSKKYNYAVGITVGIIATALLYSIFSITFHLPLPAGLF